MEKQYVLVAVINHAKAYRLVKRRLRELGYDRFTAIDSIGATELVGGMEYSTMLNKSLTEPDNLQYNKTVFLVCPTESAVQEVMDDLEYQLNMDPKKPGKGIMFTIPIITTHGVRF